MGEKRFAGRFGMVGSSGSYRLRTIAVIGLPYWSAQGLCYVRFKRGLESAIVRVAKRAPGKSGNQSVGRGSEEKSRKLLISSFKVGLGGTCQLLPSRVGLLLSHLRYISTENGPPLHSSLILGYGSQ